MKGRQLPPVLLGTIVLAVLSISPPPAQGATFQSAFDSGDIAKPDLFLARCAGVGLYMATYLKAHHAWKSGMTKRIDDARLDYEATLVDFLRKTGGQSKPASIARKDALVAQMYAGYDSLHSVRKKTLRYPWQKRGALATDLYLCDEVARTAP